MNKYKVVFKTASGVVMLSVGWYGDKYCAVRKIKYFNPGCTIISISTISKDCGRN